MKRPSVEICRMLLLSVFILMTLFLSPLYAAKIMAIDESGNLVLDQGGSIELGGVECSEEGVGELAFLAVGKDARIEDFGGENRLGSDASGPLSGGERARKAYVYVRQAGFRMPYVPNQAPEVQEMMLNEVLLSLGAARIRSGEWHERVDHFKALEQVARETGQGIWSYEPRKVKSKGVSKS